MTVTLKPRGPEAVAHQLGRCRLCPEPIRPGQTLVKVEPIGWTHVACGDGYRRVIEEHAYPEVEGLDSKGFGGIFREVPA